MDVGYALDGGSKASNNISGKGKIGMYLMAYRSINYCPKRKHIYQTYSVFIPNAIKDAPSSTQLILPTYQKSLRSIHFLTLMVNLFLLRQRRRILDPPILLSTIYSSVNKSNGGKAYLYSINLRYKRYRSAARSGSGRNYGFLLTLPE